MPRLTQIDAKVDPDDDNVNDSDSNYPQVSVDAKVDPDDDSDSDSNYPEETEGLVVWFWDRNMIW